MPKSTKEHSSKSGRRGVHWLLSGYPTVLGNQLGFANEPILRVPDGFSRTESQGVFGDVPVSGVWKPGYHLGFRQGIPFNFVHIFFFLFPVSFFGGTIVDRVTAALCKVSEMRSAGHAPLHAGRFAALDESIN